MCSFLPHCQEFAAGTTFALYCTAILCIPPGMLASVPTEELDLQGKGAQVIVKYALWALKPPGLGVASRI